MAYYVRKGKYQQVYVYVYKDGKHVPLPRSETRHLDSHPDQFINSWIEERHRTSRQRDVLAEHTSFTQLEGLVTGYCEFMRGRGKANETIGQHKIHLLRDVIPFFLSTGHADPNTWPDKAFDLHDWMRTKGANCSVIHRTNVASRGFWQWLRAKRHVSPSSPPQLNLLNPVMVRQPTPLKFTLTPNQVKTFALMQSKGKDTRMLALVGYFFSLRPQELFALRTNDFLAGTNAEKLECCEIMAQRGLFSKLAVNVQRQVKKDLTITSPKAGSGGLVACFDEEAARMIVARLKELGPNQALVRDIKPNGLFSNWRMNGIKGITLKDLRRASLYWLGHNTELSLVALRNHARHTLTETTSLYVRRPEEGFEMPLDGSEWEL